MIDLVRRTQRGRDVPIILYGREAAGIDERRWPAPIEFVYYPDQVMDLGPRQHFEHGPLTPTRAFSKLLAEASRPADASVGDPVAARQALLAAEVDELVMIANHQLDERLLLHVDSEDLVDETIAMASERFLEFQGTTPLELRRWLTDLLAESGRHRASVALRAAIGETLIQRDTARRLPALTEGQRRFYRQAGREMLESLNR